MTRPLAACVSLLLIAAADGPPLRHASGQAAAPGPGCGGHYTAARGDTLYSIARRCESSVIELVQENRLGQPPRLDAGQVLAIPGFARAEVQKPEEVEPPPPPRAAPPLPPRLAPPSRPRPEPWVYRFQAGDTLFSLARWARVGLPALRAANPGIDARDIEIGAAITLPSGAIRPEPMRLRERGRPAPAAAPAPPPPPASPPPAIDADKPGPDGDRPSGGMDDDGPQPEGM